MKYCTRCLYPDTKTDLYFDDEGVCSACRSFEKREEVDWVARKRELELLLERGKNDSGFDCIVPSSGGKDSHYQVLKLIELGARPLVVTATTCHLTKVGRENIDNLGRYATTIEVTPNRTVRAKLNRLGLELVGDISWPEHVSIFTTPFWIACDLGIPLVFYGESPQNQYGGPPGAEEAKEMTLRWAQEFGGFLGLRPSDLIGRDSITEADMADYVFPPGDMLWARGIPVEAYFLGQFYEWDSWHNAEVAREAGMRWQLPSPANWWEFENLDCTFTAVHDFCMYRKFGYGRATAQLSVDIRNGRIQRDDAKRIASERDHIFSDEYAGMNVWQALDNIGVEKGVFWSIIDQFTNKEIFNDVQGMFKVRED